MRKFNFIIILLIILLTSCDKEEITFPVSFYAPTIHGYLVTDDFGYAIKLIGSNDRKTVDSRLKSMEVALLSFPNPCSEFIILQIGGSDISKKIWIVPANGLDVLTSFLNSNCIVVQG